MSDAYEVAVIGAGPAGYHAAIRAAQLGLKTVCSDRWIDAAGAPVLGGTCLNVGCIPSKALLDASHKFEQARSELEPLGIKTGKVSLDLKTMQDHKTQIVKNLTQGVVGLLKANGVEVQLGSARLDQGNVINVTDNLGVEHQVTAGAVIVAPGSKPIDIGACPMDGDQIVDSTGALAFEAVPKTLGIIGAGVIGLELGSVWSRLGSQVVLLEALPEFLPAADRQLAKAALKLFGEQGLDIRLGATVVNRHQNKGKVELEYSDSNGTHSIAFDRVIVAVGRKPDLAGLCGDGVELKLDERGAIDVDQHCQTSLANVFAVGDAVRGPMLAHKGMEEGIMVAERLAGAKPQVNYDTVPSVIYTHPEIAWVGKSEIELKQEDVPFKVGVFPLAASGRALASSETAGMIKVIAHADSDRILGVHVMTAHGSELIAEAVIAMEFGASAEDLGLTMFAHPTLSEGLHEAALAVSGHAIHIANRKRR